MDDRSSTAENTDNTQDMEVPAVVNTMQIDDLGANDDHSHLQAEAPNRILPELNLLWKRNSDKNEFPSPAWIGIILADTEYFHQRSNSNRFLTQS